MIDKVILAGVLFFCLACSAVLGQEKVQVKRSEFVTQKEGGSAAYKIIQKGDRLMEKGPGFVMEALVVYQEAQEYNEENAELNYKIGVSYLACGPKHKAYSYLKKAYELRNSVSKDINYLLGVSLQLRNKFAEAILEFKRNITRIKNTSERKRTRGDKELLMLCEKHIVECRAGEDLSDEDSGIQLRNLSSAVNSEFDEYSPLLLENGKLLYSSRRGDSSWTRRNSVDGKFLERTFQVEPSGDDYANLKLFEKSLNKKKSVAVQGVVNKEELVLYSSESGSGDLFLLRKGKKGWNRISRISEVNASKAHDASASLTKDGKTMYFVSNRKGGQGKHDIYMTTRKANGKWMKPQNVGNVINTPFDEGDVFVQADGNALYFSSRGHNTMGGYDIFRTERDATGAWKRPVNLGFPVNSTDNDFSYYQTEDEKMFFFASERDGGKGGFDLYAYTEPEEIIEKAAPVAEEPVEVVEEVAVPVAPPVQEVVPIKKELPVEVLHFKIQIAAAQMELAAEELHNRYQGDELIEHMHIDGWHRYTIGSFDDYEDALLLKEVSKVKDAFIVLFKDDYRMGIASNKGGVLSVINATGEPLTEDELFYRVQIFASGTKLDAQALRDLGNGLDVVEHQQVDGLNCYTIGKFKTFEEAANLKRSCGIEGSFVVSFRGGKRIPIVKKK